VACEEAIKDLALLIGWFARLGGLPASPQRPALPALPVSTSQPFTMRINTAYKYKDI
jgi:hypothetical protein